MNTIYSIVWNRALGEWTAVSELARQGGSRASGKSGQTHALRHLALAIACVLGGTMAFAPAAHAAAPAAGEHQQMQKVNPRLADLSDLLAKYGNAQPAVAKKAAPSAVAVTQAYPAADREAPVAAMPARSNEGASRVAAAARQATLRQPLRAAATPTATPAVQQAVRPASTQFAYAAPPKTRPSATASRQQVQSPQLASDAQIAAVLAHRAQGQASGAAMGARDANTWVVASDGSLHVAGAEQPARATAARRQADVARMPAADETFSVFPNITKAARATAIESAAKAAEALPAVTLRPAAVHVAPRGGTLTVDARASADPAALAQIDADKPAGTEPSAPAPQPPAPVPQGKLAAVLPSTHPKSGMTIQTSSLVLPVDSIHDRPLLAGTNPVRPDASTTEAVSSTAGGEAAAYSASGSPTVAMAAEPVRYEASTLSSDSLGTFNTASAASPQLFAAAVTPMALPPDDPRRPPAAETPPPGLIMGTGGLVGNVAGVLDPTITSLLNPDDPYLHSGRLNLAAVNITQTYQSLGIGSIGLVNLTPVGTLIDGTLMGHNQNLTLLGGVTSGSYITNINRGTDKFNPGLAGVLLPNGSPAWSDTCASLLGIPLAHCWAVNAAQNNQVIIGDNASANGSEEVVIGTGASHTLQSIDANKVFPGDGDRNSSTDPMGMPDADYQSRMGHSVVIGDSASGTQNRQTILGANATSDKANSVALGYGSNADRDGKQGYTNAFGLEGVAQNSAGVVAVGNAGHERQIIHVAAGTDDHDAVNVAQLKGVVGKADKGSVKYDATALPDGSTTINYGSVTLAGTPSTDGGATNGTRITNVHQGELSPTSTDAVNGSQLNATNTTIATYMGGTTHYDGTTNTWTPPDFKITNIKTDGSTSVSDYDNVTDAFAAIDTSVVSIYNNGVKYFHTKSTLGDSTPTGTNSIAIGPVAVASAEDSIAIGNAADASMANSIALGAGSTTTVGALTDYTAFGMGKALMSSTGEVNVGGRQITGVAPGSADGDAVNVAQLRSALGPVDTLSDLAVKYDADASNKPTNTVTLVGDGTGAPVAITNLAPAALGATSTDAVNGSQLYATNTTIATYMGGVTKYDGATNTWTPPDFSVVNIDDQGNQTTGHYDNVTDAFDAVDASLKNVNKHAGTLKYFKANSTGAAASASGEESVAMGGDTVAAGKGSVAAGSGAQAKTDGAVAIGQKASADGGQAVAIGNGAQASGDGAVSIGDPNVVSGDGAVGLGKDNTVTGDGAVALGNTNTANGLGAIAMGNTASAAADGAVALGNSASATAAGSVALGEGSVASRSGGGTERFTKIAVPTVGAVSVGAPDHLRQITNVAGGTEDTDAVNVRQLQAVADEIGGVSKLAVKYDADKNGDPTNTVTLVGAGTGSVLITNLAPGAITKTSLDAINGAQLYGWTKGTTNKYSNYNLYKYIQNLKSGGGDFVSNDTNKLGDPKASGDNSAAGGAGTVASGTDSTAVGNGAQAKGANSVALGAGSVATRDNAVSVGSKGHERQITNVAAGTADTDAVNVSQLKASTNGTVKYDVNKDGTTNYNSVTLGKPGGGSGTTVIHNVGPGKDDTDAVNVAQLDAVKGWAKNYTDQRVDQFGRQLNNLGNHAYAGIASAMAMAGLPQAYEPGKNMAALAGGTFHGESSLAIGVSMISDNGRWVFKLSGTDNTRGDAGGAVGVGIQW